MVHIIFLLEGNSLAVQWLGLHASLPRAQVQSLVRELRSCKLCGQKNNISIGQHWVRCSRSVWWRRFVVLEIQGSICHEHIKCTTHQEKYFYLLIIVIRVCTESLITLPQHSWHLRPDHPWLWGHPVPYRMLTSVPCQWHSLLQLWQPEMSTDIAKYPL